jgi:ribonucleoside-diphosphate reductase alpha chain
MDMGVSGNMYYNSANYEDGNVPLSVLIKDRLTATKYGWRTFYYTNSAKKSDPLAESQETEQNKPIEEYSGCEGGACTL